MELFRKRILIPDLSKFILSFFYHLNDCKMKTDFMLNPDLLSILFENRNREYGAYELRIHYRQRLLKSLCIVPAILVLLFTAKLLGNRTASGSPLDKMKIQVGDTIRLVEFRMSPPPR